MLDTYRLVVTRLVLCPLLFFTGFFCSCVLLINPIRGATNFMEQMEDYNSDTHRRKDKVKSNVILLPEDFNRDRQEPE